VEHRDVSSAGETPSEGLSPDFKEPYGLMVQMLAGLINYILLAIYLP